jgi:hypothetical protein
MGKKYCDHHGAPHGYQRADHLHHPRQNEAFCSGCQPGGNCSQRDQFPVAKAYNGSIGMLVSAMVHRNGLTQEDIDELYTILKEAEANQS